MVAIDGQYSKSTVLRAAKATYLVFIVIWVIPSSIVALEALERPPQTSWRGMVLVLLIFGTILMVWVRQFKIELRRDAILYQSLFGGRRQVRLENIENVRTQVGRRTYRDRFLPPIRLEIQLKPSLGQPSVIINLKVFSRADVELLIEYLSQRK